MVFSTNGPDFISVIENPPVILPPSGGTEGIGFAEGNAIALIKVQPIYPSGALTRGIEGYVVVEFDVDVLGAVIDPQVLYSEPTGTFDRAALKALERWKYNPKIVNGEPVKMYGVQQKMSFSIEE